MRPHDQLKLQSGEVKKKEKKEKEPIKEGLKTEIKVRSKKQQFQEATKLANKKLREINSILEYASNLKSDLNETEYSSSSKAIESMKKSIAEAYKKMKYL
jgi:oligoendopeptidase F